MNGPSNRKAMKTRYVPEKLADLAMGAYEAAFELRLARFSPSTLADQFC